MLLEAITAICTVQVQEFFDLNNPAIIPDDARACLETVMPTVLGTLTNLLGPTTHQPLKPSLLIHISTPLFKRGVATRRPGPTAHCTHLQSIRAGRLRIRNHSMNHSAECTSACEFWRLSPALALPPLFPIAAC